MPPPASKRRLLLKGMEGEDVRDVQRKLNARLVYYEQKLAEDGIFGDLTEAAVRAFQDRNYLHKIDGKVGDETWDALNTMLGVVMVKIDLGPQFPSVLHRMIDQAEKSLNQQQQGGISEAWQRRFIERHFHGPYLTLRDDPIPSNGNQTSSPSSKGDRIYQLQGQVGRTFRPWRNWTKAEGWKPGRPKGFYSWGAVLAMTWRTSQDDRHWEYGPLVQVQRNYADPEWTTQVAFSVLYADRWHLGRWHLGSFYTQPSLTLPLLRNDATLTVPLGYQVSVDVVKDGNCNIFVQSQPLALSPVLSRKWWKLRVV
jgi:hypothetical protein